MVRTICVAIGMLLSPTLLAQKWDYCDERSGRCGFYEASPGSTGQAQREREMLLQQERQIRQQIQVEQTNRQRLQRQQQQMRNRHAQQQMQLLGVYQRELERINQEREREEAAERERAAQKKLDALKKQLEALQQQAAAVSGAPAAPATQADGAGEQPKESEEPNPFAKDATLAAGVKDPEANHAGAECSYFTKPMVRDDGSGINAYADGTAVCYGKRMYQCKSRRWVDVGRCDMYADWEKYRAERLEN